jgi:hypothetical protein
MRDRRGGREVWSVKGKTGRGDRQREGKFRLQGDASRLEFVLKVNFEVLQNKSGRIFRSRLPKFAERSLHFDPHAKDGER